MAEKKRKKSGQQANNKKESQKRRPAELYRQGLFARGNGGPRMGREWDAMAKMTY